MAPAGRYKIAIVRIQQSVFLPYKHLDLSFQNNTTLVERMFMPCIFLALIYLHAHHNQVVPNFCLAHNPRPELVRGDVF